MVRITLRVSSSCAEAMRMRLLLSRVCGRSTAAAAILSLAVSAAAQTPPPSQTKPPAEQAKPPADPSPAKPPSDQAAQPAAAPDAAAEDTSSLFAPRWNMFQLGGRFASVSGDPARWQRYQDLRDGLLFTEARVLHETPDWNGTRGRRQRRLARFALFRQLRAGRPAQNQRPVGRDPAVLQRRHGHRVHRSRRWRAAAGRQRTAGSKP